MYGLYYSYNQAWLFLVFLNKNNILFYFKKNINFIV